MLIFLFQHLGVEIHLCGCPNWVGLLAVCFVDHHSVLHQCLARSYFNFQVQRHMILEILQLLDYWIVTRSRIIHITPDRGFFIFFCWGEGEDKYCLAIIKIELGVLMDRAGPARPVCSLLWDGLGPYVLSGTGFIISAHLIDRPVLDLVVESPKPGPVRM